MVWTRRGQLFTVDAGIALVLALVVLQLSLAFVFVVATGTAEMLEHSKKQWRAIVESDRLINDPCWLAKYDSGVVAQTIDSAKKVNATHGDVVVKRLVFVDGVDRVEVV